MKRREAVGSSSIKQFIVGVYKASHKFSEFVARFLGRARDDNWGLVVFENGIVKEIER